MLLNQGFPDIDHFSRLILPEMIMLRSPYFYHSRKQINYPERDRVELENTMRE